MGVGAVQAVLVTALLAACYKPNPALCDSDADCADEEGRTFCDVNGEYAESDFQPRVCIAPPPDCPIERCGCQPGAALACDGDQLTVCSDDGASTTTSSCAFGCSTDETRCLRFEPSNALGAALEMAAAEPDVILPAGARIDTELGLVQDSGGVPIQVRSLLVTQEGGNKIRVLVGRSFVFDDVTVQGAPAFAAVASGRISLNGIFDASAEGRRRGPGGQEEPAACVGGRSQMYNCSGIAYAPGTGGGGNATSAGAGGGFQGPGGTGGAAVASFVPLVGGCRGGAFYDCDGLSLLRTGGAGGGAVQFVSMDEIVLASSGLVDVGAGGGESETGGGSGGLVVMEAPRVRIDGAAAGIVANGGAGGGCTMTGLDARPDRNAALAPKCDGSSAGNGGTSSVPPESGPVSCTGGGSCALVGFRGGGGGAVGRVRIATKDGTYEVVGTPILSVSITTATLEAR